MPEGKGYGSQSSFSGPSNSLITIGNHAYAFGGVVAVPNSDTDLLTFNTGKEYLKCKLTVTNGSGSDNDIKYFVSLNGSIVCQWYFNQYQGTANENPFHLIIPPLTTVLVQAINISSSGGRDHTTWVQGKIYGKVD